MYINPRDAIANGWITHPRCKTLEDWDTYNFISPNAVDFTLDELYTIHHNNIFIIREDYKQMRGGQKKLPTNDRHSGQDIWRLDPMTCYDGMSSFMCNIPDGVACELIIRSTLNRNGIFLTSGIFDSGFSGNIGFVLHNNSGSAEIAVGTRIGQIKFLTSDNDGKYTGQYNTKNGQHWADTI